MEIVATQAEVKDTTKQIVKAQVGDAEPAEGKWSGYLRSLKETWLEAHAGIKYDRHPLLNIEPELWYMTYCACCTSISTSREATSTS
jgi:hypothetical protein